MSFINFSDILTWCELYCYIFRYTWIQSNYNLYLSPGSSDSCCQNIWFQSILCVSLWVLRFLVFPLFLARDVILKADARHGIDLSSKSIRTRCFDALPHLGKIHVTSQMTLHDVTWYWQCVKPLLNPGWDCQSLSAYNWTESLQTLRV